MSDMSVMSDMQLSSLSVKKSARDVNDKLKSHLQKSEVVIRSLAGVALILPKLQLGVRSAPQLLRNRFNGLLGVQNESERQ